MSIRRHTVFNLLGQLVPLLLALATVPLYLRLIGDARYGALAIVWLLVGYFGLLDLGLGRAVAQRLPALEPADHAARARVFWTALAINAVLGLAGAALVWLLGHYTVAYGLNIEEPLRTELVAAWPWIALTLPLAAVSGVLTGALQAQQRFGQLNLIAVGGTAAGQLLPLLVAMVWGPSLALLVPAVLLTRAVTVAALLQRCLVHVAPMRARAYDRGVARGMLGYGGWVTVTSLVGPMMVSLDRFVIGSLMGAKAVSDYTIPFQLAERSTVLSGALSAALFPRLAAARDDPERRRLALEALAGLAAVMSLPLAAAVLLIEPFLRWWISPELANTSGQIGQVLLLAFWLNGLAMVPYTALQAGGRPDIVARCHLAELLPYLALLALAVQQGGLLGAAMVFTARVLVDLGLLCRFGGMGTEAWHLLAPPAAILLLVLMAATPGWLPTSTQWLAGGALLALLLLWSLKRAPAGLLRPESP